MFDCSADHEYLFDGPLVRDASAGGWRAALGWAGASTELSAQRIITLYAFDVLSLTGLVSSILLRVSNICSRHSQHTFQIKFQLQNHILKVKFQLCNYIIKYKNFSVNYDFFQFRVKPYYRLLPKFIFIKKNFIMLKHNKIFGLLAIFLSC